MQETIYLVQFTAVRPLLKRINVTLYAPHWYAFTKTVLGGAVSKDEHVWEAEDIDWLYPVRQMKSLGFTRFERLSIKVVYQDYKSAEMENEFHTWTKERIHSMADMKELEILFCRAGDE